MSRAPVHPLKRFQALVHILIWCAFLFLPLLFIDSEIGRTRFVVLWWFWISVAAGFFYTNDRILIPKLLFRKKLFLYILSLFILIGLTMLLSLFYFQVMEVLVFDHLPFQRPFFKFAFIPIFPSLLAIAVSAIIRITGEWLKTEKLIKEMEHEKAISELAFLKSQVNPHFLFNILNNICALARKKSDNTEDAIIKLSNIMRYMLEESKDERVPLEKEVTYLNNYIELQQLRTSDKVMVSFESTGNISAYSIQPLLLIPFVENAFKHGVSYREESRIRILLQVEERCIRFGVENTLHPSQTGTNQAGSGIGLKNVTRRLDLLYPGRHRMVVSKTDQTYSVTLEIDVS